MSSSAWPPSAARVEASTPGSADGISTTAPAPSPKSTLVLRSAMFSTRERISAPITTAFSAAPDSIIDVATVVA